MPVEHHSLFDRRIVVRAVAASLRKLDLLGMDACLMSMAEVGYQVRSSVELTVGSEQTEPVDGWPYDALLAELARNPAMTGRDLSTMIVTKYVASYRRDPVTQSACDLTKSAALAEAITAHHGTVAQYLGDGLLAFFGAVEAGEDDPENAIRAALEAKAAVANLPGPEKVQLRAGIHSGLVVVGELGPVRAQLEKLGPVRARKASDAGF